MKACVDCEARGPGVIVPGSDRCVGCMDDEDLEEVRWDLLGDELIAVVASMRVSMAKLARAEQRRWQAMLRAEQQRGCEI